MAAELGKVGVPRAQNPTETSLDVEWDPVEGATEYEMEFREYAPDEWGGAEKRTWPAAPNKVTVEPLNPTTTYQFRMRAVKGEARGEWSETAYCDTLVANCGPKQSSCAIQ